MTAGCKVQTVLDRVSSIVVDSSPGQGCPKCMLQREYSLSHASRSNDPNLQLLLRVNLFTDKALKP
jgi:hypothetical protein